jgi:hypothetical protein
VLGQVDLPPILSDLGRSELRDRRVTFAVTGARSPIGSCRTARSWPRRKIQPYSRQMGALADGSSATWTGAFSGLLALLAALGGAYFALRGASRDTSKRESEIRYRLLGALEEAALDVPEGAEAEVETTVDGITVAKQHVTRSRSERPGEQLIPDVAAATSGDTYKILAEYSAQGLAQSQTSFRVNLGAAILGFLVIVTGVLVAIFKEGDQAATQAIITIVSGAIVDAVSALIFGISARTQKVDGAVLRQVA